MKRRSRRFGLGLFKLTICGLVLFILPAVALADYVVQGFAANGNLKLGEVVSLDAKKIDTVQATAATDSSSIYGVVVDGSKAPVVMQRSGQQVYVTAGGDYPVLVSTENGVIHAGDYLSMSGTAGIAAKATPYQPVVVGHATQDFDGVHSVVGHTGKYAIGDPVVTVSVVRNPLYHNTLAIPSPLQKIGNTIAGHEISPLKIYIGIIVFVVAMALTIILLMVGIRSAMISIGRNPLSRHLIVTGLAQVIATALVIFIASLAAVYLILKL